MRKMKDSGVEWIGQVPEDWNTSKLNSIISSIQNGYVGPTRDLFFDEGVRYIQSLHVKEGKIDFGKHEYYVSEEWATKHPKIHTGDLLIVQTGDIGQVGVVEEEYDNCNCHALIIIATRKDLIEPHYLAYFLMSPVGKELLLQYKTGALLPHLNAGKIVNMPVVYPKIAKQIESVSYLDSKCAQIDTLIANQQQQIEKLKQYKQAVITEAVTRGLDPNVQMKDSGVEWIGEVPEHWKIIKANRVISSTQNGDSRRDLEQSKGNIVLKLRNITAEGIIDYSYQNRMELTEREKESYALHNGDLLFVRVNGSRSLVGKCAVYEEQEELIAYNDHIIRVRINHWCDSYYLRYYLLSAAGKTDIELHTSTAAGQFTISGDGLRDMYVILPSHGEQESIVTYLDTKCAQIDALIAVKQQKADKLAQYKKSLIYEVVTGKREISEGGC